jgi:hypothetical protein
MSCFKFVDYENQRYEDIDVCSQMRKIKIKNQSSKSKLKNKTSKSKIDLFPKTKSKNKKVIFKRKKFQKFKK